MFSSKNKNGGFSALLTLVLSGTGLCVPCEGANTNKPLPEAAVIMRKLVERADQVARDTNQRYRYEKRSLTEELNSEGKLLKSTKKEYEVLLVGGYPLNQLVRIQGQNLSKEALAKEDQREQQLRKRIASFSSHEMAARRETWVTQELVDRFEFTVRERSMVKGRPTLKLDFKPRSTNAPARDFADKLLNCVTGSMEVDEHESTLASISLSLNEPISVGWLGLLGIVNRCEVSLQRIRLSDGVWANLRQTIWISGRKLLAQTQYRITEQSSQFQPVPGLAANRAH